jgi:hypothetical protein
LPKAPFIYRPLCGHLRTRYLFVMDNSTLKGRLRGLGERYYLMVGPLLLVIGVGSNGSPFLTWTAVSLLSLLTINKAFGPAFITVLHPVSVMKPKLIASRKLTLSLRQRAAC